MSSAAFLLIGRFVKHWVKRENRPVHLAGRGDLGCRSYLIEISDILRRRDDNVDILVRMEWYCSVRLYFSHVNAEIVSSAMGISRSMAQKNSPSGLSRVAVARPGFIRFFKVKICVNMCISPFPHFTSLVSLRSVEGVSD